MSNFVKDTACVEHPARVARFTGWAGLAVLLALSGCDKSPSGPPTARMAADWAPAPPLAAPDTTIQAAKLAYRHDLQLEMPAANIAPRYERAVKDCQENAALNCVILNAAIRMGDRTEDASPSASLTVRLPHNAVAPFEAALLAPLPGEASGDAVVRSRTTTAEDLANAIADVDRRQAQLSDYRDRLGALAKRDDVTVEDLIKIESELANTQSQLDTIAAQKKNLAQRVDTEIVAVSLDSPDKLGNVSGPIVVAWHQAGRVLGESTAVALSFTVAALPWLPIVAIVLLLLRLAFRRWRR
jgi:hypothetical protein